MATWLGSSATVQVGVWERSVWWWERWRNMPAWDYEPLRIHTETRVRDTLSRHGRRRWEATNWGVMRIQPTDRLFGLQRKFHIKIHISVFSWKTQWYYWIPIFLGKGLLELKSVRVFGGNTLCHHPDPTPLYPPPCFPHFLICRTLSINRSLLSVKMLFQKVEKWLSCTCKMNMCQIRI